MPPARRSLQQPHLPPPPPLHETIIYAREALEGGVMLPGGSQTGSEQRRESSTSRNLNGQRSIRALITGEFSQCHECPPSLQHPWWILPSPREMTGRTARRRDPCRWPRTTPLAEIYDAASSSSPACHPVSLDRLRSLSSGWTHNQDPCRARGRRRTTKSPVHPPIQSRGRETRKTYAGIRWSAPRRRPTGDRDRRRSPGD